MCFFFVGLCELLAIIFLATFWRLVTIRMYDWNWLFSLTVSYILVDSVATVAV